MEDMAMREDGMNNLPTAATEKVFKVAELLEEVLLHVRNIDLLRARRTCKQWKAFIDGSKRLQIAMCFPRTNEPCFILPTSFKALEMTAPETSAAEFLGMIDARRYTLNPLFSSFFAKMRENLLIDLNYDLHKLDQDSYNHLLHRVFLTQPPATQIQLAVQGQNGYFRRNVQVLSGVTVGHALQQIAVYFDLSLWRAAELILTDRHWRRLCADDGALAEPSLMVSISCAGAGRISSD